MRLGRSTQQRYRVRPTDAGRCCRHAGTRCYAGAVARRHAIKLTAHDLDVPVLITSCLRRSADEHGGRPRLQDLSEAEEIAADLVLLLYRDDPYDWERSNRRDKRDLPGMYARFEPIAQPP
jgi:hypothetical protein